MQHARARLGLATDAIDLHAHGGGIERRDVRGQPFREAEPERGQGRGGHPVRRECGGDLCIVRRSVRQLAVVIIERQEVDHDLGLDAAADVQQDAVDHQRGQRVEVADRVDGQQLVAKVPDAPREQLTAGVAGAAAGRAAALLVLAGVVGAAQRAAARAVEAQPDLGRIEHHDRKSVAHALPVGALAAARDGDEVVPVLVVHDGGPRRVRVAAAGLAEVDRLLVGAVPGVPGAQTVGAVHAHGKRTLVEGRIRRVDREHGVADSRSRPGTR